MDSLQSSPTASPANSAEKATVSNTDALSQARAERATREALAKARAMRTRRPLTFREVVEAYLASRPGCDDSSTVSRLAFWCEVMGDKPLTEVSEDDISDGLAALRIRGAMGFKRGVGIVPLGKPISAATLDRYTTSVGSVYRYAREQELTRKAFVPPVRGFSKKARKVDKISEDLYVTTEQVDALVAVARVIDKRWQRLPALLRVAFCTGLRRGALEALTWGQIDVKEGTVSVSRTKNGDPIKLPLTPEAIAELKRLGGTRAGEALVFAASKRNDKPYAFDKLWKKACEQTGIGFRRFHSLRHGTASALAASGQNQKVIMDVLGHKSLASSQVYMHLNLRARSEAVHATFK